MSGTFHGVAGFQEWLDIFYTIFSPSEDHPFDPEYVLAAANEVVVRYEGVVMRNGSLVPPVWVILMFIFRRGKIVRLENYFDTGTAERYFERVHYFETDVNS